MDETTAPDGSTPVLHREVQRKLGRCLIRLQQYEKLMKAIVVEHHIAGPASKLANIKENRGEEVSKKSLGLVVGQLTESFLATPTPEASIEKEGEDLCTSTEPWFKFGFRIEMSEQNFENAKDKLTELVNLRNQLVHHFLDDHEIWTEAGRLAAEAYLDDRFAKIEAHFAELRDWANHLVDASTHMANFMRTKEFDDFLVHGILPGGAGVTWNACTIVNLLRDAETALAKDGWTSLQEAINHIGSCEPEHTPARYGCNSWRQVLHESRQFDIRKEQSVPGQPHITWYRSKACPL